MGLEIKPAKLSDAGNYLCQLKNPLGEDESTAKASVRKVYQAPNFTQKFTDLQQVRNFGASAQRSMINLQIVLYHSISSAAEPREGCRSSGTSVVCHWQVF